jgi:hypothetical protein
MEVKEAYVDSSDPVGIFDRKLRVERGKKREESPHAAAPDAEHGGR